LFPSVLQVFHAKHIISNDKLLERRNSLLLIPHDKPRLGFQAWWYRSRKIVVVQVSGIVQRKCMRERKQWKNIEGEIEYLQLLKIGEVSQ
jgi:hypothetical protein